MQLTVKCFATLAAYTPQGGVLKMPEGALASDVIQHLGVAQADVKILFVNGRAVEPDAKLAEGDRLGLFPAVGGG